MPRVKDNGPIFVEGNLSELQCIGRIFISKLAKMCRRIKLRPEAGILRDGRLKEVVVCYRAYQSALKSSPSHLSDDKTVEVQYEEQPPERARPLPTWLPPEGANNFLPRELLAWIRVRNITLSFL